jgi:16S rRNA (cytidine1402-2'-O)-methyltransferase
MSPSHPLTPSSPHPQQGVLYVVALPIGNLEDITLRALRVLREVELIAAEDTRVTGPLLAAYGIETPLTAYQQHRARAKAETLLERLREGAAIALVSDAGMPGISDPGAELIRLAVAAGIRIVPVPGATALVPALAASGLPSSRFVFDAFPPRDAEERHAFFVSMRDDPRTTILYESPRRLVASLTTIRDVLGERRVVVAQELTRPGEAFLRGPVGDVLALLKARAPTGQCVLLVEGAPPSDLESTLRDVAAAEVERHLASGVDPSTAVRIAAASLRLSRREVDRLLKGRRTAEREVP